MIIVNVKELSIDRALKILKNKVAKTGAFRELRARQEYKKPSVERREELLHAKYIQKLRQKEEDNS
jgi:small subunit ribosomal protein S21